MFAKRIFQSIQSTNDIQLIILVAGFKASVPISSSLKNTQLYRQTRIFDSVRVQ